MVEAKDEQGSWQSLAPDNSKFTGVINYTNNGLMQVQLHLDDRRLDAKTEEISPEFINGYVAYYATYEVDSNMDIVTHKRIAHLNNASVMDVERSYVFKDDLLILSPLVANLRLTWKRIYKP